MSSVGFCIQCRRKVRNPQTNIYCSDMCRYNAWKNGEKDIERCYYCGMPADTIDHVPPQSSRATLLAFDLEWKFPFEEVRCCHECNVLLGNRPPWQVKNRKRAIKNILGQRYRRFFKMPEWTDAQLAELGYSLKRRILRDINIQRMVKSRMRW